MRWTKFRADPRRWQLEPAFASSTCRQYSIRRTEEEDKSTSQKSFALPFSEVLDSVYDSQWSSLLRTHSGDRTCQLSICLPAALLRRDLGSSAAHAFKNDVIAPAIVALERCEGTRAANLPSAHICRIRMQAWMTGSTPSCCSPIQLSVPEALLWLTCLGQKMPRAC